MFLDSDQWLFYSAFLLNLPFIVWVVTNLSTRYHLEKRSITERTPLWLIVQRVTDAVPWLILYVSAKRLAVIDSWRSYKIYDGRAYTWSNEAWLITRVVLFVGSVRKCNETLYRRISNNTDQDQFLQHRLFALKSIRSHSDVAASL